MARRSLVLSVVKHMGVGCGCRDNSSDLAKGRAMHARMRWESELSQSIGFAR